MRPFNFAFAAASPVWLGKMTTTLRELTDTEVDAVTGGCHGGHHFRGLPLSGDLFGRFFLAGLLHSLSGLSHSFGGISQSNITVQIGIASFGGSVLQTSNSTNVTIVY